MAEHDVTLCRYHSRAARIEGVQWWSVGVSAQRSESLHELAGLLHTYERNVAVALNMRVPLL